MGIEKHTHTNYCKQTFEVILPKSVIVLSKYLLPGRPLWSGISSRTTRVRIFNTWARVKKGQLFNTSTTPSCNEKRRQETSRILSTHMYHNSKLKCLLSWNRLIQWFKKHTCDKMDRKDWTMSDLLLTVKSGYY